MSESKTPARLERGRLRAADEVRRVLHLTVPDHITPEDLKKPATLATYGALLRPNDRVEVTTDRGLWWVEALVVDARPAVSVTLAMIRGVELHGLGGKPDSLAPLTGDYCVRYNGPYRRWCVYRGVDVLKDQLASEGEAWAYARSVERATAPREVHA